MGYSRGEKKPINYEPKGLVYKRNCSTDIFSQTVNEVLSVFKILTLHNKWAGWISHLQQVVTCLNSPTPYPLPRAGDWIQSKSSITKL